MKENLVKTFSSSLWISILFFVVGAILFTNPDGIVDFTINLTGGLFLAAGIYKIIVYYLAKKKMNAVLSDLAYGVVAIIVGIVLILSRKIIRIVIRFVMGAWILYIGLTKIVFALQLKSNKMPVFKVTLIVGILLVLMGLYMILQKDLMIPTIGLFIMIYSVLDIIQYVFCAKPVNKSIKIQ